MTENKRITKISERIGSLKIRTKMVILIFVMAAVSISLFWFLWRHQADAANIVERTGLITWFDSGEFIEKAEDAAKHYNVPESEDDAEGKEAFEPFLDLLVDEYTGVSIYGRDDGLYRYGRIPDVLDRFMFGSLLSARHPYIRRKDGETGIYCKRLYHWNVCRGPGHTGAGLRLG